MVNLEYHRVRRLRSIASVLIATVVISAAALQAFDLQRDWRRLAKLDAVERRDTPLHWASAHRTAFQRFGTRLPAGERFAIVLDAKLRRYRSNYRLLSQYYFYPAIYVASPTEADHVISFGSGAPPPGFTPVLRFGDAWMASRTP